MPSNDAQAMLSKSALSRFRLILPPSGVYDRRAVSSLKEVNLSRLKSRLYPLVGIAALFAMVAGSGKSW
jgi:hypothetical protein